MYLIIRQSANLRIFLILVYTRSYSINNCVLHSNTIQKTRYFFKILSSWLPWEKIDPRIFQMLSVIFVYNLWIKPKLVYILYTFLFLVREIESILNDISTTQKENQMMLLLSSWFVFKLTKQLRFGLVLRPKWRSVFTKQS